MLSTAALLPTYKAMVGGVMPVMLEPMLMTLPPSFRCLAAAWVVRRTPRTLTLKILLNDSSVIDPSGVDSEVPELFTRTSSRPWVARLHIEDHGALAPLMTHAG